MDKTTKAPASTIQPARPCQHPQSAWQVWRLLYKEQRSPVSIESSAHKMRGEKNNLATGWGS